MKNMYIIISKTNTKMGRFIRTITQYEYNHVSLALNNELSPMYSFARYHQNRAFIGGFVEESWLRYLLPNKDVDVIVFLIPLSQEKYQHLEELLNEFIKNKDQHRYNFIETIRTYLPMSYNLESNNHTCLSFVVSILKEVKVLPRQQRISNIKMLHKSLTSYPHVKKTITEDEIKDFFENRSWDNDQYIHKSTSLLKRILNQITSYLQ